MIAHDFFANLAFNSIMSMKYLYLFLIVLFTTANTFGQQTVPSQAEERLNDGIRLYLDGSYDKALAAYGDALLIDSTYAKAYFYRAKTYQKMTQPDKALADYTTSLLYDAKNVDAYMFRAGILLEKELYENALVDFTKAIELDTNNANAYLMRASVHNYLGRPADALPDYDKSIAKGKRTQVTLYQRGKAKETLGLSLPAIEDYTESLKIMPGYEHALIARAILYFSLLEYDKSLKDFNLYISRNQSDGRAYYYRARIYQQQNNAAAACKDFDKAISTNYLNPKEKPAGLCK